jgi:hypothetical protein
VPPAVRVTRPIASKNKVSSELYRIGPIICADTLAIS